jgi:hypothetical protein
MQKFNASSLSLISFRGAIAHLKKKPRTGGAGASSGSIAGEPVMGREPITYLFYICCVSFEQRSGFISFAAD